MNDISPGKGRYPTIAHKVMAHVDGPNARDVNGRSIFAISEEVDTNYNAESNVDGLRLKFTDESAIHVGNREYETYIL